ncbi:MAG: ribonuclease HIII [Bacilli bacterium]|nr:ribonuclease HIII [Bacilli bacterium]MDD4388092.1 ribonuclease HIII [Bacilli bacterium]
MSYTINLTTTQAGEIISRYHLYSVPHTNNYTLFRAKYKGATLTIFKTLTMLIQGAGSKNIYGDICEILDIEKKLHTATYSAETINLSVIGTDEVGTGDFFGPVVVAAAYVPKIQILPLMRLGVKDSKKISDFKVLEMAPELMKEIKYDALILNNLKYNYLTTKGNCNMNKLKALLHNNVIHNILQKITEYDAIIVDAFTTQDKYFDYLKDQEIVIENVELTEKGESKYTAIACASIIARYLFIKEMDKLSKEVGFDLPKGAGNKVDLAISKILKEYNDVYFNRIAKVNFKNLERVKGKDSRT